MDNQSSNLLALMEDASSGSKEELIKFYQAFLDSSFFVPDRYQKEALSHSPKYPNDFVNILGVETKDRVIIPIFSDSILIEDWFGQELNHKKMKTPQLLEVIPKEWWLVINPHLELTKEFSPWEIEQLRGGKGGIQNAAEDLNVDAATELTLIPLEETEYTKFKTELTKLAQKTPTIQSLYLTKESCATATEKTFTLLVGIETTSKSASKQEETQKIFQETANKLLIGDSSAKILIDNSLEGLSLGIFKATKPFYEKISLLQKIKNVLAPIS